MQGARPSFCEGGLSRRLPSTPTPSTWSPTAAPLRNWIPVSTLLRPCVLTIVTLMGCRACVSRAASFPQCANNVCQSTACKLIKPPRDRPLLRGPAILALLLLVIVLSFLHVYYIGGSGDGDLLWNGNEAYLFVHGERRGYHVSYLGYLPELVKGYFGVIGSPDDESQFTLVIRMTPSKTERCEEKGEFHYFTPINNNIYAGHNDENLWKWTGSHFEKASIEEQRKLSGIQRLSNKDFNDANGWSGRYSITSKIKEQFPITLGGSQLTLEVTTLNLSEGDVSVDVMRPNRPPETIFNRNGQPRRVRKSEYERAFGSTY